MVSPMSRHEFVPDGWPSTYLLAIGWDHGIGSYFAQVIDTSISDDSHCLLVSFGDKPPHFHDFDKLENLMRVVNTRFKATLPPIQLTPQLRRTLKMDTEMTVVNSMTVKREGQAEEQGEHETASRPWRSLGTADGYLTGEELKDVFDGMADKYFRLEAIYLAKKADGLSEHNDEDTQRIYQHLGTMGGICHTFAALVKGDALVAAAALKPFQAMAAEAARVLDEAPHRVH
jgi:hypothetical protein